MIEFAYLQVVLALYKSVELIVGHYFWSSILLPVLIHNHNSIDSDADQVNKEQVNRWQLEVIEFVTD